MNKKEAKNRIEELRKQVEYHAKRYYDDDEPEISDFEYDMLMVFNTKSWRTCKRRIRKSNT